jgi:hypothetical protein
VAVNRRLIHVPIIHTQADMGALGEAFKRAVINQLGERKWQLKVDLVERAWTAIEQALAELNLRYELVRIYQDGLPVCGHELRIVTELARAGSRNHRLLLRMHQRGATIMGTESAELLVEEYQLAKQLLANSKTLQPRNGAEQNLARTLLKRRDEFIAARINDTLKPGETGIVFLGLLHSLRGKLAPDIELISLFGDQAIAPPKDSSR